jgi:glycolate oxidase iron-sulfur subunit
VRRDAGGATDALAAEQQGLLACVHCGFCLNACPTYTRLGHEGDSPRGRLDLMRAVVEGRLAPDDPAFQIHIDRCLGCRACEPVCPSGVPYGFLLERARVVIARTTGVSLSTRLLIASYTGRARGAATVLSRLLRWSRLPRLLLRVLPAGLALPRFGMAMLAASAPWPGLRRAGPAGGAPAGGEAGRPRSHPLERRPGTAAGLPATDLPGGAGADVAGDPERAVADPHALAGAYPDATAAGVRNRTEPPGRVRTALLRGCVQQSLFARVNRATVDVLEANGCEVLEVPGQRCCGALDAHAGRLDEALELARANIAAFEASGADFYVVNAAGCGAMMKEYGEQLRHDAPWAERAAAFVAKVRDAAELLAERGVRPGGRVELRITYDAPCHLLHAQRIRSAPLRLLDAVPGVEQIVLPDADECCGGAGLYGVHHPELGGRILRDKVAAIQGTGADAVATPNPGCMMQIGAGLIVAGAKTGVVHPIEVLAESYRREREGE